MRRLELLCYIFVLLEIGIMKSFKTSVAHKQEVFNAAFMILLVSSCCSPLK